LTISNLIKFNIIKRLYNLATIELDWVSIGKDRPSSDQDNVALAMFSDYFPRCVKTL
ncbi:hypothetical protein FPSE_11265, partial [Fusarium pseudograminearum CS3096]